MSELIPFQQTGLLQQIVSDYLFHPEKLSVYYQYPVQSTSVSEVISNRSKFKINRELLTSTIIKQYNDIELTYAVSENISQLKYENTFTVTSAHQPNLLGGPLYVIHKIVSVIKLAQDLNKEYSDLHFVPVFWMGSEDHDKAELAHINLFGKPVIWNTKQTGAFGRFDLNDIGSVRQQVFDILGNNESAERCKEWLDKIYFNKNSIECATRSLLHALFGAYGLVIIHGDDADLKRSFIPVMEDELIHQRSKKIVEWCNQQLISAGYDVQAVPRDINLFYMSDGSRARIQVEGEGYRVGEQLFPQQQMIDELHNAPEHFSPNVILRPLYQASILPDIVFAGGGAEIAYHLQLKGLYNHYHFPYPLLFQRDIAIYTNNNWRKKLEKTGLSISDLFQPIEQLTAAFVKRQSPLNVDFTQEKGHIETIFTNIKDTAIKSDVTLKAYADAELKKVLHAVDAIAEKIWRSEKRKSDEAIQQLIKLREQILPNNMLHERYDNFLAYYMKYGNDYIAALMNDFDARNAQLKVIHFN